MRQRVVLSGGENAPRRIASRYRVLSEVAHGGMGTVYAVVDESTGRKVALKRLGAAPTPGTGSTRRNSTRRKGSIADKEAALQFQLEYSMLAQLRHPSIIEVYDYGLDGIVPYYTMELLDGRDLREVAPTSSAEACRLVRDIASSLALIHAHRLVHRDVSPRNVRVTRDGRAKLLDFGTMTPFGVPPDIAGTPSCVPPEALNGAPLDDRADIYSLGCLLYWLLTGREAYPVRRLDDLPGLMEIPPAAPSSSSSGVSEELDAFVFAMLARDPLARPASAAEVISRLGTIARLEPEEGREIARAYLSSSKTVGRTAELREVTGHVDRTLAGRGAFVLVEGDRGFGKTRFVREVALQAQLRGATVVAIEATLHSGPQATVRAIGARLLHASPADAVAFATAYATYLCHAVPELATKLPHVELATPPTAPGEWQTAVLGALHGWLVDFSVRRPLVVIVDDVDRTDDASAGLVASLGRAAAGKKLLVVATARAAPPAFLEASTRVALRRLEAADIVELLGSLFGGAPNTPRFARWLLTFSGGTPLGVMELLRHLIVSRIVRYADGVWMLPNETPAEGLPGSVEEAIACRFSRLSPRALALAEALSIATTPLRLGMCLELSKADVRRDAADDAPIAMLALDELVSDGVLEGSEGCYRFAEESLRELLLARLDGDRQQRLHRLLGRALAERMGESPAETVVAGFHLLKGGEEDRGSSLLARAGRRLLAETDDLHRAVPALEAALAVHRKKKRPPHELAALAGSLASAAFFVDRRLAAQYGPDALQLLSRATGLSLARKLRPVVGRRGSVRLGAAAASVSRTFSRGQNDVTSRDLLELLLRSAASLAGVASICVDGPAIRRVLSVLAPLSQVGDSQVAAWVQRYCRSLLDLCEGRFHRASSDLTVALGELESAGDRSDFPEPARKVGIAGVLYALGVIEGMRDGPGVLEYAARLEALNLPLYDMVKEQLRVVYHAHRGEITAAKAFRARVEHHAMMRGSAWQVEVWDAPVMMLVHINENDVVGLRRTAERLGRLAAEIPSLQRFAMIAEAAHKKLRGKLDDGIALLEGVIRLEEGPFAGRGPAIGLLAECYNARGDHLRAVQLTRDYLLGLEPDDRVYVRQTLSAVVQHAHALAGLGDFEGARGELDRSLRECAPGRGPLTLGLLHQARARVALWAGDLPAFDEHVTAMERWLRPTENPALIAACERLRLSARREHVSVARHYRLGLLPVGGIPDAMSTSRRASDG